MSKLVTPRPSRPTSPTKSQLTKPSVLIDDASTSTADSMAPPATFTLASLTCATPLSPSHPVSSAQSENQKISNQTLDRDSDESTNSSAGIGISPDILAVGNLLSTMKSTLGVLGTTFDFLGEHTAKAAALGPAIDAMFQIHTLRTQLSEQYARQEGRMDEINVMLKNVLTEQLSDQLRTRMDIMIQEVVGREIKQRVEHQLKVQIPQSLREQVMQHKRQILQVQTNLHNSEARRYNATLRSASCLTEPLRPLLRPLPTPLQSPCHLENTTVMPPTPAVPRPPASTPTVGKARTGTTVDVELEPPTPSPFFPRDLTSLFCLNSDAARALVREYGLVEDDDVYENQSLDTDSGQGGGEVESSSSGVQQIPTPTSTTKDPDVDSDSREKNLTRFMVHIGVPYQMIPDPNSTKRKRLAPLITTFKT